MIETDVLYAFVKESDWLKPVADELLLRIKNNQFGVVYASREALHELYYVSREEGVSLTDLISRVAALTSIDRLVFLETTAEIDLLALAIMKQFGIRSIFDAYHAATALNQVSDHTLISTDDVFDRVSGLSRIDPRTLIEA
ncbi:MAG: type II toxin-antitoxin system VapC family toxin [Candidatus Geothermarchaeales archaeon]